MATVLITGGTGALGGAVTERFLADGHQVAVSWLVPREHEALRSTYGDRADLHPFEADVTDEASVARLVQEVRNAAGPVEVLVHLVGGWHGGQPVHEHATDAWHRMQQLNVTSAFLCSRAVLGPMRERNWGRIVFVSARTARVGRAGQAAYAVAKAGVAVLAETIAEENLDRSVTANCVAPSVIDTEANRRAMPDADWSRWVTPAKLADAIAFLASDPAGELRGAWLPVFAGA